MQNYINIFNENLNFTKSNSGTNQDNLFFYKLENFDIFDTLAYEKFSLGFSQISNQHIKDNILNTELLADIIHSNYGMSRTYILEKDNIEFLHQGLSYSFNEFSEYLELTYDLSFVDYSLFLFSYLLQQYTKQKVSNIDEYILNKGLLA